METINKKQLVEILKKEAGNEFIGIDIETIPAMRKTNNPYYEGLTKCVSLSGGCGANYQRSINNKLERAGLESDFKSSARSWGVLSDDGKFVYHKDQTYLNMIILNSSKGEYKFNNESIEYKEIEPFLQKSSESKRQTEKGIEAYQQVAVRTIKLDSIKNIRLKGVEFEIKEN